MKEELTDQVLVARVQAGDQKSFNLLVIRYQNKIANVVAKFVPYADVPDVTQEVFIKAYRSLPSFRGESSFYTWLYRVASNTAKNHLSSESRSLNSQAIDVSNDELDLYESNSAFQEVDNPENLMLSEELNHAVFTAIQELPEELKAAIILRELEGFSYEEIAEKMKCPVGTVRSRIFRAREMIDTRILPLIKR